MSKAILRAHFEQIWNNKDASAIERFIAPNYRGFEGAELISGIEGYKRHFVTLTTAFPDTRITIEVPITAPPGPEVILEEGGLTAARWFVEGTHTGPFGDIQPTGKRVRVTGIAIIRISNRQIVEEYANSDTLGLLKQLGIIPITPESVKVPPFFF
jgi:predicted ester cyclase